MKRRILRLAAVALVAVWSCAPRPTAEAPPPPRVKISGAIRELVARADSTSQVADHVLADTLQALRPWDSLRAFYEQRGFKPAWSNGRKPNPQLEEFLARLRRVGDDGLNPEAYDSGLLQRMHRSVSDAPQPGVNDHVRALARLDVRATHSYLRLAEHLARGRVPAAALDRDWTIAQEVVDWPAHLDRALDRREVALALDALEPPHDGYRRLKTALAGYRAIAARGGWPSIPAGPPLQLGDRGARVGLLIQRLAIGGDFFWAVTDTVFDRRVERVVGDFQSRHGIPRSGIAGNVTLTALNVPVEERIDRIGLGLERWRWLPDTLGARHVTVNIPAYRLDMVREGRIERSLRVVVGKRTSPTPIFSDRITYLELNPTWSVPRSIIVGEIVPTLKRRKDYLAANRMRVVPLSRALRDTSVDAQSVPWNQADSDSFPYLVIQDAGPDNPLGRIKFMCPNEYDVYLHDTPTRERFGVAVRDFSHGCVRVAQADEFADSLIGRPPGDTTRFADLLADSTWRRMRLPRSMPVHFLYWTSWVDDSGHVQFRDDVYGLDRRLGAALRNGAIAEFQLNPGVELSPYWLAAKAAAVAAAVTAPRRPSGVSGSLPTPARVKGTNR
ncbi:MAG TPA: L,D-transpeptidase family protein [Candidatus Limnocylindria bacterium]|nr:L,D-transpeptidase family protein [Candidatus Limnocylindria bacterium]